MHYWTATMTVAMMAHSRDGDSEASWSKPVHNFDYVHSYYFWVASTIPTERTRMTMMIRWSMMLLVDHHRNYDVVGCCYYCPFLHPDLHQVLLDILPFLLLLLHHPQDLVIAIRHCQPHPRVVEYRRLNDWVLVVVVANYCSCYYY